jgi:hypothetical protein
MQAGRAVRIGAGNDDAGDYFESNGRRNQLALGRALPLE